ncbi:MAG: HipA domain-containing protein [Gammaproteobacteria bacterium]|nr:HipA domain-containing protein [Gammaproteobacteria bacterium]
MASGDLRAHRYPVWSGGHASFSKGDLSAALEQFFRQYALAMILRNGDAHLKNFDVLYFPGGGGTDVRLAPCYDMVTMAAYAPISPTGVTHDIPALM